MFQTIGHWRFEDGAIDLSFADRQAWTGGDLDKITAMENPVIPLYDQVGCTPVHPTESNGTPAISTTLADALHAGHADGSVTDIDGWPQVGCSRVSATAMGHPETGSVILASVTEPGGTATPASTWDTEVMRAVLSGSGQVDGRALTLGSVRVAQAGAAQPAVVAGTDGLREIVILGDRRHAEPTACEDRDWAAALKSLLDRVLPVSTPV